MKTVAAVCADFGASFLGGAACLDEQLAGEPILRRTLERAKRIRGVERTCLLVRPEEEGAARDRLAAFGLAGVDVLPIDTAGRPRRSLTRSARKWSLERWRGNVCCATWFDEYVEPRSVAAVLDETRADAALFVDGCQPILDGEIASSMIERRDAQPGDVKLVFTQAPPGLAGILLRREVTRELLEQQTPVGVLMGYRPENPQGDPIARPVCWQTEAVVSQTAARLTGDTRRSRELLREVAAHVGLEADAAKLCAWLRSARSGRAEGMPVEIELELTTEDPLSETRLRPRGGRVPARRVEEVEAVARVAREAAAYDDAAIVLGGFGDPLLHPRFGEICRAIRAAGVCGLAVTTPLVRLSDEAFEALFESAVDVLEVLLDADDRETYRAVHGIDGFETVVANIERIGAARRERNSPQPLVVPSLTRCAATLGDMDGFFDRWIRTTGSAVIRGYSTFGGLLGSDSLISMTPLRREGCRRLSSRLVLLGDGSAVACDQDVEGRLALGDWRSERIETIWKGERARRIRDTHVAGSWGELRPCGGCTEWHRS